MDIETRTSRYLAILGGVAPADARHLASLGAATQAQRFASGLHSVGVGLYGPVVAEDHLEAEDLLERGQAALLGRGGNVAGVKLLLSSALDFLLGAERDLGEVEAAYLLNLLVRLLSLYWAARGRADRSLRVLYAGRIAGLGEALLGAAAETARWRPGGQYYVVW